MREIGTISNRNFANRFVNFMHSKKIDSEVREGDNDLLEVWVWHEKDIIKAKEWLRKFCKDPDNPVYIQEAKEGVKIQKTVAKEAKDFFKKQARLKEKVSQREYPIYSTVGMIIISCLLYLLQNAFPSSLWVNLFFSHPQNIGVGFPEILSGQIWRIFTPMFLHATFWHLFFNMMWLFHLGQMVERDKGTVYMISLALLISALANTAQYLVSGGNFLGISGVVYGLLGFVWVKGRLEGNMNYFLSTFNVGFLFVVYLLCVFGVIGGIANANHGVGLCVGMIWGFFSTNYLKNVKRLKPREIIIGFLPFILAALGVVADIGR